MCHVFVLEHGDGLGPVLGLEVVDVLECVHEAPVRCGANEELAGPRHLHLLVLKSTKHMSPL